MSPLGIRRGAGKGRKRGANPLAVAAVTILIAAAITYWGFDGKQIPFVGHFTVYALVNNSVDITGGSPVRIAGVDVGQVTGTSADGNLTKVAFTLASNGQPVHSDATVTIRDRLFLEGAYYLQLAPGSPGAPIVHSGFTIPASNTAYPVQFFQLLSTFDLNARASLENTLNTLNQGFSSPSYCGAGASVQLTVAENPCPADQHPVEANASETNSGAGGLKSAIPQLTPTLKDVAWISQGLHGTEPGDVERLLSSGSDVTVTLQRNAAQLGDLVTGLDEVSSALASADGAVAASISGLDQTLQVAPAALSAVDHSLPPLAHLATALGPSLKVAPPIIDGVTKAVEELASVVGPAERGRLLDTLQTTFERFPNTLRELGSLFPVTKSVTDCLRTHVTPILKEIVPDGSLSTGRPAWQDFVHLLTGLSSAVQNFDGNGYWIRLIGSVGNNSLSLANLDSGASTALGARPAWVGDLTASDFRPDVSCATQPVPSLSSSTVSSSALHAAALQPPTASATDKLAKLLGMLTSSGAGH